VLLRPDQINEIGGIANGGEAAAQVFAAPWVSAGIGFLLLINPQWSQQFSIRAISFFRLRIWR